MALTKCAVVAALGLFVSSAALATDGVTPSKVTFGQVAAFEGPAAALGTSLRDGLHAAFEEANAAGGIHGRQIALRTADDGYEPGKSADAVKAMIGSGSVFALIGAVGTPTSKATQPLATEAGVPFIGPFTGASFLRDAEHGNVVNIRATYAAETEAWIAHLVDDLKLDEIAILYQDDAFGRVGLAGVTAALEKRGMNLAVEGTYTRNTVAVKSALLKIRKAKPDAVVMVGAYKPVAEFIKLSRKLDFDPVFVNISFVGSKALANELGAEGEGVIVSQVVPFPWNDRLQIVAEYQAALAQHVPDAEVGFVSLEGYITGRIALAALDAASADVTREGFLDAVWSMRDAELGGLSVQFSPTDNQAFDYVFLTEIDAQGDFVPVKTPGS